MPTMSLPHRVVEIPPARRDTHNHLDLYWWKHSIDALLRVDVTAARELSRSTRHASNLATC
jgi:pterin-4a-carbinolamine dehydratase